MHRDIGIEECYQTAPIIFNNERGAVYMNKEELRYIWKKEEEMAHIVGWDFSHIHERYDEERDLSWDYEKSIRDYLMKDDCILDYDTGGGEFVLSLGHPYDKTYVTEGFLPNVELCKKRLLPLGIHFKECHDPSHIPYNDEMFDMIMNRHGDFNVEEFYRLLKEGGMVITEQVGCYNDRDLVEMVLPETDMLFPDLYLRKQKEIFENKGFHIIEAKEDFRPIYFYDVGAFVWYAHIIEWEFPNFSVDRCFERLLKMQEMIENKGRIEGTIHRYLIIAKK